MKKFKYIGDCEGNSFRGIDFPIGKTVEVKDEDAIKKLMGNSHFSEVKTRKKKAVENGNSGEDQG